LSDFAGKIVCWNAGQHKPSSEGPIITAGNHFADDLRLAELAGQEAHHAGKRPK